MFAKNMMHEVSTSFKRVKNCLKRKLHLGIEAPVDEDGNTLLHLAVREGNQVKVLQLLLKDAHVNSRNKQNETPLHLAVKHGHPKLIDLLIANGALLEAETKNGSTPIHMISVSANKIECLEHLLKKDIDINARDNSGNNLFHLILKSSPPNLSLIRKLVENGSNVHNLDILKENCLHSIALSSTMDNHETRVITRVLVALGINLNAENVRSETPLHKAVWGENSHLIRVLLQNGARMNIRNFQNLTAFDLAIKTGHVSSKPIRTMIKNLVIKKHRCLPIDGKLYDIICLRRDLIAMFLSYEEELSKLKTKKIHKFSSCTFYQILCRDVDNVRSFISEDYTPVVLTNVSAQYSNFYWEIVDAWNYLLFEKNHRKPVVVQCENIIKSHMFLKSM